LPVRDCLAPLVIREEWLVFILTIIARYFLYTGFAVSAIVAVAPPAYAWAEGRPEDSRLRCKAFPLCGVKSRSKEDQERSMGSDSIDSDGRRNNSRSPVEPEAGDWDRKSEQFCINRV